MKSAVIFLLVSLSVWGTVDFTSGVKCEDNTGHTCTQSLHVTETCREGQCECVDGYFPNTYGCQEVIKPRIKASAKQAFKNGIISIDCLQMVGKSVDIPGTAYRWFKDGVLMPDKTRSSLYHQYSLRSKDYAGQYSCSVTVNGVESLRSDSFNLTFVPDVSDKSSYVKPVLVNVPEYYVDGMPVEKMKCVSNLATTWTHEAYRFYVSGQLVGRPYQFSNNWSSKTLPKTPSGRTGPLSCSYTIEGVEVQSDEVAYPEMNKLELAIRGPQYVPVGSNNTWRCLTSEMTSLEDIEDITVAWFKDGTRMASPAGTSLTRTVEGPKDAGVYTCSVSRHGDLWTSSPLEVETVTASSISITPSAPQGFNETTLSLECDVTLSTTAPVLFNWHRDGKQISGYTDNVLHVYDERSSEFECRVGWAEFGDTIKDLLATARFNT